MDKDLYDFYKIVDLFWHKLRENNSSRLQNVTLISIGGGARDLLVKPGLTYDEHADLNVLVRLDGFGIILIRFLLFNTKKRFDFSSVRSFVTD